ncbi:MAG: hypothetical protein KDK66_06805, partial [Deltaproteobacteria bacterium]|nr:hypothetical protein [Deltaproteobacteria bacterium]
GEGVATSTVLAYAQELASLAEFYADHSADNITTLEVNFAVNSALSYGLSSSLLQIALHGPKEFESSAFTSLNQLLHHSSRNGLESVLNSLANMDLSQLSQENNTRLAYLLRAIANHSEFDQTISEQLKNVIKYAQSACTDKKCQKEFNQILEDEITSLEV